MRILLLTHAFDSLSQRLFVELRQTGHELSIEFDINEQVTGESARLSQPELIIAPFPKRNFPIRSAGRERPDACTWDKAPRLEGDAMEEWVGALHQGKAEPVSVQHIVRSFDPCMVCTIH